MPIHLGKRELLTMALIVRDKSFYKTLFVLAIPIVLQNLVTFSVGFIDNLMVGKLGEYAISGVFMGNQIQMILQILIIGIASSMQILSVQYWGKRDTQNIKTIVAISFRITLTISGLFWLSTMLFPAQVVGFFTSDPLVITQGMEFLRYVCFSYVFFGISQLLIASMRSVEAVKIGLYVSILALLTHFVLNWLLIYGNLGMPALGVRGAGISTLVSRILEAAVMACYVLIVDKKLHAQGLYTIWAARDCRSGRMGHQPVFQRSNHRPAQSGSHGSCQHFDHAAQHGIYFCARRCRWRRHNNRKDRRCRRVRKNEVIRQDCTAYAPWNRHHLRTCHFPVEGPTAADVQHQP
jgi:Na+-driven multidrug efflux pump